MAQNDTHIINMKNRIWECCEAAKRNPIGEQNFSIYRVPAHIRMNNESYYEPRMVSIGPYHQGKKHLRAMEEHKWRYLGEYINKGNGTMAEYIQRISEMEPTIRDCYFESFDLHKKNKNLVETMLLDSCFIIQLFIKWRFGETDPVRNIGWALPLLMADLIMIENQIPFFVLEKVYNIHCYGSIAPPDNTGSRQPSLIMLLVESLNIMHNRNEGSDPKFPEGATNIKHLLNLYYLVFVPAPEIITSIVSNSSRVQRNYKENGMNQPLPTYVVLLLQLCNPANCCCGCEEMTEEERSPRMIPSAKELQEFGVTFKKKKDFKSFLDISFNNGVLEIPYIVVEESIRSKYLNLIAFEQCRSTDQKHLTTYAVVMDCLINTSEDVIALQRCGIIENKLADTAEVANFFNQLRDCAYINYEDHYMKQVFVNITNYCQTSWPKYRAKLYRDYFSNPWSILAFCAASLILCITVFNTIYFIITTFF